ncbi:MAG: hypothetical protein JNM31_13255 [Flavobacteriales bacterium]|nr:hypothetical protein [Flavobacteriales bacterium]
MKRVGLIMERFWMVITIATALVALYAIYQYGFAEGRQWLWFPLISSAMWAFRRFMRGRLETMADREQQAGRR